MQCHWSYRGGCLYVPSGDRDVSVLFDQAWNTTVMRKDIHMCNLFSHCLLPFYYKDNNDVWNQRQLDCLFNSLISLMKRYSKVPHYWPFVRGMHRWPMHSPHKGPVMRKAFPDVITGCSSLMQYPQFRLSQPRCRTVVMGSLRFVVSLFLCRLFIGLQ